ncbi:uncharacterized protein DNG_08028 [Cephalotrichum gorgonifer]|uniref:F-box domain-containing protein n=1 Tax=Cephalotrichum gorgonifer TaxID=2041049 RepID=A0AAE8SXZ3_9PEZI|nr:uncharacterized protein DNG_08028 [Cephalotrichum gorgonifer]
MPPISHLPTELLCSIASLLDTRNFTSFRLSSRLVHGGTIPLFAARYFKRRHVFLERHSLESLVDIARHPVLGPAVHTLDVSIARVIESPDAWGPNLQYSYEEEEEEEPRAEGPGSPPASPTQSEEDSRAMRDAATPPPDKVERVLADRDAYIRYRDDQRYVAECGLDTAYLTLALATMPNCKTLVLSAHDRPWGARTLARRTGLWPTTDIHTTARGNFARHTQQVVLSAAFASGIKLEKLDILFMPPDPGSRPSVFVPELAAQHIRSRLINLNTLCLTLSRAHNSYSYNAPGSFTQFLELFPRVECLELCMNSCNDSNLFTTIADSPLHMTALRDLELHGLNCTAPALAKFLCRHQGTLKDVRLKRVHVLQRRGWGLIFHTIRRNLSAVEDLLVEKCRNAGELVRFRNPGGMEDSIRIRCDWDSLTSTIDRMELGRAD